MRQLGQLEAAVMQRLWSWNRSVVVREVLEDLQRDREIAYTTVMTVLDNLYKKGLVVRSKQGRAHAYLPAVTREEHTAGLLDGVLSQSTDRGATLLQFVGQLSQDDLVELRSALDRLQGPDETPESPR